MYDQASTEPLEIIRANECESQIGSLATNRFRALWNEIERLRTALKALDAASIATTEPNYVAVPARTLADAVALADEQSAPQKED